MNDPTKDIIPRSAVEYCLRKETVSTNPEKYKTHETFIDYMNDPDISEFGHWMHTNGFNCALTAISVDLKKIPSVTLSTQQWIPCSERLPDDTEEVLTTYIVNGNQKKRYVETATYYGEDGWSSPCDEYRVIGTRVEVIAWMPLPNPYKGEADG